ncbi:MAG: ABC transporter ATP-binding protein [Candidatus Micropelagos thuwalensis]
MAYAAGIEVLRGFTHSFEAGSFTAIVGPSGCGKSSLLRILAGLQSPSSGKIEIKPDTSIGYVFQEPTLLAWRTIYENVALPLKIKGLNQQLINTRVVEALALVGLADRQSALPRELSGGMKMRVSLARALAQNPDVLFMDEPFGALDELTRLKLDDELLDIWRRQKCTILFVTHTVSEATYLAERVLVMSSNGQLKDDINIEGNKRNEAFRASTAFHEARLTISKSLEHNEEAI